MTLKKIIFIFDFSERGREGEEGQKHQCERETSIGMGTKPETKACAPTGNWAGDLSVCGTIPSQLSHTDQGNLWLLHLTLAKRPRSSQFVTFDDAFGASWFGTIFKSPKVFSESAWVLVLYCTVSLSSTAKWLIKLGLVTHKLSSPWAPFIPGWVTLPQ